MVDEAEDVGGGNGGKEPRCCGYGLVNKWDALFDLIRSQVRH
jgi:hypothetical protein